MGVDSGGCTPPSAARALPSSVMAPEFGDTQVIAPQAPAAPAVVETPTADQRVIDEIVIEDAHLPSMEDLDGLVVELDLIDATLAELR